MNIRDLMLPEDALEMEGLFDEILREHNEQEEFYKGFREAERRAIFDWEVDAPEFNF